MVRSLLGREVPYLEDDKQLYTLPQYQPQPQPQTHPYGRLSALHYAIRSEHESTCTLLLEKLPDLPIALLQEGGTRSTVRVGIRVRA